ncbi:hypothetical protein BC829DRAFT_399384 [Chytridium lagenaria]|nr:hypothetical protein BC829DRAFT_399384 [Chytridium lagenaria]
MKALTVISAALVAVASFASAQTTTTVPSYRASCGQNQATFDLCVKNALTDTSLIIYADVPTACIGQTASQLEQFTCQCFWLTPFFLFCVILINISTANNCDAAAQFSTTRSVATATTTGGSASSPSVAVTTGVVTATTAPAATTKTSAAGRSCTLHSALISVFGAVCVAAAASAL